VGGHFIVGHFIAIREDCDALGRHDPGPGCPDPLLGCPVPGGPDPPPLCPPLPPPGVVVVDPIILFVLYVVDEPQEELRRLLPAIADPDQPQCVPLRLLTMTLQLLLLVMTDALLIDKFVWRAQYSIVHYT